MRRHYERCGHVTLEERWRGSGGEIDLIFSGEREIIFVEVKRAKQFALAAERISPRQIRRLFAAAEEYLSTCPEGLSADVRFDAALVDGRGAIEIRENVFAGTCP